MLCSGIKSQSDIPWHLIHSIWIGESGHYLRALVKWMLILATQQVSLVVVWPKQTVKQTPFRPALGDAFSNVHNSVQV